MMIDVLIRNINNFHYPESIELPVELFPNKNLPAPIFPFDKKFMKEDPASTNDALKAQIETFKHLSNIYAKENSKLLADMETIFSALNDLMHEFRSSKKSRVYFGEGDLRPDLESLWRKMKEAQQSYYHHKAISITAKLRFTLESHYPQLSGAESQVASLIWAGFTTRTIADICILSERTIENHRLHLREKLHIPKGCGIAEFLKNVSSMG